MCMDYNEARELEARVNGKDKFALEGSFEEQRDDLKDLNNNVTFYKKFE